MKFVQKDRGKSSENSSGGGMEGFFKEIATMFLAYIGMILSIIITGLIVVLILTFLISRI